MVKNRKAENLRLSAEWKRQGIEALKAGMVKNRKAENRKAVVWELDE
jgi:hypothetical protein